jgi:Flp pilus assembly protein TadD
MTGWAMMPIAALAILPAAGHAQGPERQVESQDANARLSYALGRLNHNPRDTEALILAGNAALATGDTDAAVGFFTRADRLSPDNPRVQAGLAGAKVRAEDPFSAIPLFIAAEKGGPISPELLGDRGLAYDLIGDNANAQQYYRQALANGALGGAGAEVSRRLALSLAIVGDRRGSETVLATLLQKQDRAAWRTRVFVLAILGYEEEAVSTAKSVMPPDLALEIAPYLRYMRRLTPAQQAAAANLGHFPQAAEIGHDDPRVAQYARLVDRSRLARANAGADRRLVPAGAPWGISSNGQSPGEATAGKRHRASAGNPAPPELMVSRDTQTAAPSLLSPAPPAPIASDPPRPAWRVAAPPTPRLAATAPTGPVVQPLPRIAAPAASTNRAITRTPTPVFNLAARPLPHVPGAAKRPEPAARPSFSEAFAAMSPVVVDVAPARGAVDLRKIKPARAVPPPPPPPSHPSRIWVELGVGRDTERIAFDWRHMVRDDPEIFRGKKPFVSSWARTNRLLVGPFETDKAANVFTEKLHKADHGSAFVWTSPAGQVVDPLEEP